MSPWIERETPVLPLREVKTVGATCDACGESATLRGGNFPAWCMLAFHIQGVGRKDAVICRDCQDAVLETLRARGFEHTEHDDARFGNANA